MSKDILNSIITASLLFVALLTVCIVVGTVVGIMISVVGKYWWLIVPVILLLAYAIYKEIKG